jgi:vacuolar-type H+-ATPase subunit E/Vma4
MNHAGLKSNDQVQELLKLVEQNREHRCTEILEQAGRQAEDIVRQAYRSARARLHQAVEDERRRTRQRLVTAQAELLSRHRRHWHRLARELLDAAWQRLEPALEGRWQEDSSRAQWVDSLVTEALERLPAGTWRIIHPPDWDEREQQNLVNRVTEQGGEPPVLEADSGIRAGLRITTDGVCLDGTCQGLLRDRAAIEARLLYELRPLLGTGPEPVTAQPEDHHGE